MDIYLKSIIPEPLKDRVTRSEIWKKEIHFASGRKIHITSPSAGGKTTLISIIYGLRTDYSGEIFIDNNNAKSFTPEKWSFLRQNMLSIVFQNLRLFDHLTGMENIKIKANLLKSAKDNQIVTIAEKLEISNTLNKKIEILSFGERQRIAIIRALVGSFKWLLLDEPFSHLDNATTRKVIEIIQSECKKKGSGIILAGLEKNNFFPYDHEVTL